MAALDSITTHQWPVTVEHRSLVLRPFRRADQMEWESVRQRSREWLTPWDPTPPDPRAAPVSFGQMVRSFNRQGREGTALPWLICLKVPPKGHAMIVGQLSVSSITRGAFQNGSIGYWIAADQAGRGLTPRAVALAVDYCFQVMGLHRIEINIRPENAPSLRVVQKLGLRSEGLRRRLLHIAGDWRDHESFAITAEEVPEGLTARLERA